MTSTDSATSEAGPRAGRRTPGSLRRLLRVHLRPHRRSVALVILFQFGQMLAMLWLPALNADIIDNGVIRGDTAYILRSGAVMLGVTLLQIACAAAGVFFAARTAMAVGRDIRAAVFSRVQEFSVREVGRFGAPSLITRTTNDVEQVQMLVLMGFVLMVPAPIMGIGGALMALNQDVPLSGLLLFILPALIIVMLAIVGRMGPLARQMQERIDDVNRVAREQITGIRVIRAFVRDEHERQRFAGANTELMSVSLRFGRLMAVMMPAVMLIMEFSSVAVMWFGSHRIAGGSMQFGALIAFLSYLMQILMAVMMATFAFMMTPRARVCAERVQEVLDTTTSLTRPPSPRTADAGHGLLELRGVDFGYPGAEEQVLRDVNLIARPGQTTAVIGSTGSGKTTLLNLIPRLADTTGGAVVINGVDVRELDRATLPGIVGLVPQKPYLFSGTIATNLRYGRPDATDADLWHALEVAQAAEFVAALPEGLDGPIGQGGNNVSGGQRQRLAIARVLVARPEIYLFDDSFSALDYATDAALRAALAREIQDATLVIVAQRVSTIRDADRIVVLDEGRVVGTGTHTELMAGNQTYREIVLSQLTEQEAS
ncbi:MULTISPECIES: ABC transporter ATP-binding protein [Actinoalloteichus]|uniref:ABC-type multidrug transport system, ATPase and permease component n=1 Tax=Actinoalloteichus fjordicus TaxID=1612552 RepID=A0AAC9PRU0_9PSEU|nr:MULTISPECIES: ABC transporter ATP-binding protein [Actinoalloteichus]APU14136.1 ABC-type multidrug transport system, ATPase and permease component [Actinoalloteichus fjordicus]APU20082.1 ABC-type multidrug transport system, ATPase and permease component [Actinoalloteichus sp. GBA129-24]